MTSKFSLIRCSFAEDESQILIIIYGGVKCMMALTALRDYGGIACDTPRSENLVGGLAML